ncbi:hypothetical protein ID866_11751 [Astraeus odoratus]|nr:hypothetical protein ID866_11751 [Astraeus odoratus]
MQGKQCDIQATWEMAVKEYKQCGTQSLVCTAVKNAVHKFSDRGQLCDAIIEIISNNIMCQSLYLTSSLKSYWKSPVAKKFLR